MTRVLYHERVLYFHGANQAYFWGGQSILSQRLFNPSSNVCPVINDVLGWQVPVFLSQALFNDDANLFSGHFSRTFSRTLICPDVIVSMYPIGNGPCLTKAQISK